jgi:hypothetical protein
MEGGGGKSIEEGARDGGAMLLSSYSLVFDIFYHQTF